MSMCRGVKVSRCYCVTVSILHGVDVARDLCLGVNVSRCDGATVYQKLSFDNSKLQLLITVGSRTITEES